MHMIADEDYCEVVFTLRRRWGMSDADFGRDAEAVAADPVRSNGCSNARKRGRCPLVYRTRSSPPGAGRRAIWHRENRATYR